MNLSGSEVQTLQTYSYGVRPFSVLSTFLQLPKRHVIANHQTQTVQEPLGRPHTCRMLHVTDNLRDTRGATCKWQRNRGELVRERPARTSNSQTSPAANLELHCDPVSLCGKILQTPTPLAVTTSRMRSTIWADALRCQSAGYNPPPGVTSLNALNRNIAPGRPVLL